MNSPTKMTHWKGIPLKNLSHSDLISVIQVIHKQLTEANAERARVLNKTGMAIVDVYESRDSMGRDVWGG